MSEILFTGAWTGENLACHHCFDEKLANCLVNFLNKQDSVVDFGAGLGSYTIFLRNNNFNCMSYDGTPGIMSITDGVVNELDLSRPIFVGKFDVVLCLEVGEHIPSIFEDIFINNLVRSCSKKCILSWAIPGQAGFGHVNCKDNDYLLTKLDSLGLKFNQLESQLLRDNSSLPWFANTLMVFDVD